MMERVLALRSSISPSSRGLSPNLLMALMTSYRALERIVEEHEVLTPMLLPLITLAVALPPLIELLVTLGHLGHRLLHILKGGGAFGCLCVLTHHPPEA